MLILLGIFRCVLTHSHIFYVSLLFSFFYNIVLEFFTHEGHEEMLCNYVGYCLVICLGDELTSPCIFDIADDQGKRYTNAYMYNAYNMYKYINMYVYIHTYVQ